MMLSMNRFDSDIELSVSTATRNMHVIANVADVREEKSTEILE